MDKTMKALMAMWLATFTTPILFLLLLSFTGQWRFPSVIPTDWSLGNWTLLIQKRSGLFSSLLISFFITVTVAVASTAFAFRISRIIAFHPKKNLLTSLAYLPFIFSPVIFASVINFYFIVLNLSGTIIGVVIAQLLITFPFAILLFVNYWDSKLKSYEDLVYTLGGNSSQAYWKVTIPVSKNMLVLCFFQTFLTSWFDYGLTSVIGVGKIQTLTIKVFQYISEANPYYAAVSCCLLIAPPLMLLFINKSNLFRTFN